MGMEIWRESISSLFESRPRQRAADGFRAHVEAFFLDDFVLGTGYCNSIQDFDRSPRKLARDCMDGYLLQFYQYGKSEPRAGGAEGAAGPGDLYVLDLAQPLATTASPYGNLNLLVPRHVLAPHLRQPDTCHETVLPAGQPLVTLFRDALTSFYGQVGMMTMAQAQQALRPLLDLAAVAMNGRIGETHATSVNLARFAQICRHVEDSLLNPELTAETVAAAFGLSRRSLYRAFEPFDGFAAYVKDRRLHRARAALLDPANRHLAIATLAQHHGFANPEHFSRAFRDLFGVTPREVRHIKHQNARQLNAPDGSCWAHWVRQVGRQGH